MSTAAQGLLALAREAFPDLTEAEQKLFCTVAVGNLTDCSGLTDAENDPNHAEDWGKSRTIRAMVIRWLCVEPGAIAHVDPRGICIQAANIDGTLDLDSVTVPFPLALLQCAVDDGVNLCDARTRRLNFQGSHIGFLAGDSLIVQGGVSLSEGFQAAGGVTLVAATIHGELVCSGGSFLKQDEQNRYALNVDGVKVGGRVLFTNGFLAVGGVSLFGAMIADNCECQGGYFFNPDGVALYASKAKIGGNVFLRNGFRAAGEVRLHGATITGNLECQGGCFFNPGRTALLADGVKVGGRAFFWKSVEYDGDQRRAWGGFLAWGVVSLVGALIFSDLDCTGGRFLNRGGRALAASQIEVGGSALLREEFRAFGEVNLCRATIHGDLDCIGGRFLNRDAIALFASKAKIGGSVSLSQGFRTNGLVNLFGSGIGDLDVSGAKFLGRDQTGVVAGHTSVTGNLIWQELQGTPQIQLDLTYATVGQLIDDEASWPCPGKLSLDGFIYKAISPAAAKIRIRWLERQAANSFYLQPYEQLAQVLRGSGQEADAKRVLIAKQKSRRTRGGLSWWARPLNWFLGLTMAHGYQPQRLLGVAVGMTLLGWGLFAAGDHAGTMIPTKAEAYTIYERTGQVPASYPAFCAWMYSLDTLVPIINFGQKDHWRPRDPRPASPAPKPSQLVVFASTSVLPSPRPMTTIGGSSGLFSHSERWSRIRAELIDPLSRPGVLRIYRWFHMGIGWLLITLGIAGVTGLVRKE